MEYFELLDNVDNPKKRWFLGSINFDGEWDFWKYIRAGKIDPPKKKLLVSVRRKGIPIDFTMADFQLLVVNDKVKKIIGDKQVQYIPLKIMEYETTCNYYLMVINDEIKCVDEDKSVFDKYMENDLIRPDKAGQYKTIYKCVLNAKVIPTESKIFRIKDFNVSIIINQELKSAFENNKITGITFKNVT